MTAAERVLSEALAQGVRVYLKGDRLAYRAANGVPPGLLPALAEHKGEILAYLQEQERLRAEAARRLPPIVPAQKRDRLPLSYAQQRLWFIDRLEGATPQYHIPGALRVQGTLDVAALGRALDTIVARHESLRTVFREVDGEASQVILDPCSVPLPEIDLRGIAEEQARERELRRVTSEEAQRPFDLSRDLPLRVKRVIVSDDEQVLLLTLHHIASDGWSMGVLRRELTTLYDAFREGRESPLPPMRVQYGDYAQWQRRWLQGDVLERHLGYWRRQLAGLPAVHGLPLDRPRKPLQSIGGTRHIQRIAPALREQIEAACRAHGVTLFMFLEAVFAVLLSRSSQESDIVLGSPIAGRVHQQLEPLIGFFVNTLVLRNQVAGSEPFDAFLAATKQMILDAHTHQHVPFEMIVEELKPERSLSHTPLFQILFAVQHTDGEEGRLGNARVAQMGSGSAAVAQFELELTAVDRPNELLLYWAYRTELFDAATIERLAARFEVLLAAVVERPATRIDELPLLTPEEREELLARSSGEPVSVPDVTLNALVEAQAARTPDAIAVRAGDRTLTYAELNARADALAEELRGIGRPVAVQLERSPELIVALLGILKSGTPYLPIDPSAPPARVAALLADANAIPLEEARSVWTARAAARALQPAAEDVACIIYTSGSTGGPKGVEITHRAMANHALAIGRAFELQPGDRVLQFASIAFDVAGEEIFPTLAHGASVAPATADAVRSPEAFLAQVAADGITVINLPTPLWQAWMPELTAAVLPESFRLLIVGSDRAEDGTLERWHKRAAHTPIRLLHGYGVTEATITSLLAEIPDGQGHLPLGRPIAGTRAYVVDDAGQPVPVGVVGELWIGGAGLARGYLNRPELTAERFIRDPFSEEPGARVYRTGDRVRWRADGTLEFLGRRDHQVKLRGFRIELGEIESALRAHPQVSDAAVAVRDDPAGGKRLAAYAVATASVAELRDFLAARLPHYMVPPAFVLMEALPLTPSGKIDRRALPEPDGAAQSTQYVAPRTELERRMCAIWQEVLGRDRVGIEDNFFELGGHSLLATRLASRVRALLGRELPLRALFEHPTIGGLCETLPELGGSGTLPPIVPLAQRVRLPLSYAQQRLWFIDRLEGGTRQYNIPAALRVQGSIDVVALGRALDTVVARHESLRTVFRELDGEVSQVILEPPFVPLPTIDLRHVADGERELRRLSADEAQRPFDLSRDLPLRVKRVIVSDDEQALLLTLHHIASDGWSMGVLRNELTALYDAYREGRENPLPPLRVQYADYAHWQRQWLQGEVLGNQLSYWKQQLAGLPAVHNLPLDRPRQAMPGIAAARHIQRLPKELRDRIEAACRAHGVTLFMFLEAAFAVLLSRSSQESDVVVGSPIAGRVHQDLEPLIGFFVNTLVLRSSVEADDSFETFLARSRQMILDAYAHQHVPFEMLVEELKPERSLSHTPLFQILFSVEHAEGREREANVTPVGSGGAAAGVKFELQLTAVERPDELLMLWAWRTELFDAATIERMAAHFEVLLSAIVDHPGMRVAELPLLTERERAEVLAGWNEAAAPLPTPEILHELFEAQVERRGEAPAVACGEVAWTYAELNARANQLAHELRALGVGPDSRVAIVVERNPETLAGILAILKAGGAYVPLDPAYPFERLRFMIEDSAPAAVLAGRAQTALFAELGLPVIDLGDEWPRQPRTNPGRGELRPGHLAYIIYTSGSTGTPKGVMVEHRSVCHLTAAFEAQVRLEPGERILQFAPLTFDVSVAEIFTAFRAGATLVLRDDTWIESAQALWALCDRHRVNVLRLPMRFWQLLAAEADAAIPQCVRLVGAGGEAISQAALAQWFRRDGHRPALLNTYGPTEITVNATWQEVTEDAATWRSIGGPLPTTRVYVLDPLLQPVPVGVAGEIYVGGVQVARGYLNRPELTAERFLDDPFVPGGRMYRTGDLGRWLPNGTIEFLGRNDFQIKLRGFRIEPGEIEAVLRLHPAVRDAVVVAREDRAGDPRLVAYVAGDADVAGLREHVRARLPEYMIPSAFVVMEALPLTSTRKVDRRALPAPDATEAQTETYVAPRTELERRMCGIWQEVLGLDRVGIDDNFFELGGHSLLATRLASRVRAVLGRELPLRAIFEHPTIAGLCETLPELGGSGTLPPIVPLAQRDRLPLSYAQQRLWFIDRLEGGTRQYNIPAALRVQGALDRNALGRALDTIVARHESLRTVFRELDGEVSQVILDPCTVPLPTIDLRNAASPERELRRLAADEAERPFDLSCDLPLRVKHVIVSDDEQALLLTLHHIASDGWSMGVLRKELTTLYEAYREGRENPLPPLHVQYADYAHWQRRWLQGEVLDHQLRYWKQQLDELPAVHNLPLDRPRKAMPGIAAARHVQRLPKELREKIEATCRAHGVTLFMFLEAAFAVLLSRSGQESDVVVGSPIAGRVHQDLEPLIGFFVNTLVLRSSVEAKDSFETFLAKSKQTILDAYAHQHVPFEMLVEELKPERSLSHTPLFQILFAVQQAEGTSGQENVSAVGSGGAVAKFELEVTTVDRADELVVDWSYRSELFEAATVERMSAHFEVLLSAIVERPETRVGELPLLTESEREQLLVTWNATGEPVAGTRCLHELVIARAAMQPDSIAVIDGTREVTYAELIEAAYGVAAQLRELGIGPEQIVGVCVERRWEMVATLLGVLASGGAYLPLDPNHPKARLTQVLEGSGASVVIAHEHLLERLPWTGPTLALAGELPRAESCPPSGVASSNLAYVLFTSGSTGTPKGVAVMHSSAVELIEWARTVYSDEELAGVLAATSLSFDLSVFELFVPLSWGGTAIVAENALALPALPARDRVRLVNTVPSAMAELVRAGSVPASVRTVNLAGEPLPRALADQIYALGTVEALWNLYGPSEDTTYSTYAAVERVSDAPPSIGRPITGTRAYVVDDLGQLVPIGVTGELWLGGAGLARGYLHRPDLTAERFIRDPFSDGPDARVYRTGDRVRWRGDGMLGFLGRRDHQVKLRGFRIELGEIEAVLRAHAAVRDVVVIIRDERIVAYVAGSTDAAELREHVRGRLPEYMVPSAFVVMEALPLTPNGKIDRRALPAPEVTESDTYVAPRTELERQMCGIWQEVLGLDRVGIHDNFFELGGHSLLATRLASRVRALLGRELPLRAIFEHPTVGGLCETLPELGGSGTLPPIVPLAQRDRLPLSYAQQRLWFIDRLEGGTRQYNIPAALRVQGSLDLNALGRALDTIVARHESLRTVFRELDGEVSQVILDPCTVPLPTIDLRGAANAERELRRLAADEAERPFDLSRDLPLRVTHVIVSDDEQALLLTLHHIASDGWSMGVLRRELTALYEAYREGRENPLPPLHVQYADYAHWQRRWLQGEVLDHQLRYWKQQLDELPAVHNLPLDRPRKAMPGIAAARYVQRLPKELREKIEATCRAHGVTLFMFLEAAFAVLLSRSSQESDVVVGSPIAGRVHQDLEPLIGFFVNTLVLRSNVEAKESFATFLAKSRQMILDAYAHQHVPFEMLVEELKPERSLSHTPLFQILFAVQQAEGTSGQENVTAVGGSGAVAKFELEVTAFDRADELVVDWTYRSELFDAATVERMAAHFEVLLSAIVERPETRVGELPLLTESEREQLLVTWNATGEPVAGTRCLHELVIARAAMQPDAVAVIDGTREVTYKELIEAAYGVAAQLRELGIGPEQIVGVCVERGWEMVATLLGVLASGGAYLPLDPNHPKARLAQVLEGSGASVVIAHEHLLERLPWTGPTLALAGELPRAESCPPSGVTSSNLAYVLFTSGSTGTPKGVAVMHSSAVELIEWARTVYSDEELAGVLAATSLSFDLSVFELFVPLSWGGTVIVAENALALPALPARDRVRLVNTVPSAMAELVRAGSVPPNVRTVNLAGEPLPRALADQIYALGTVEALWNLYGPSEDTTYSTYAAVERVSDAPPSIGRPITGTRAYVVDEMGQLVPIGVTGELWLGGAGLARGYLHRPDLTAERFIQDPFSDDPNARVYRTGDRVRWRADGRLDFLGRRDHQVKLRGFRIELGEIEAVLRAHAAVRDVVAIIRDERIVAYVAGSTNAAELREHVRGRLPEYMVPSAFVVMEALPLTPNGKIDRRALPAPDAPRVSEPAVPRDEVELRLAQIWADVLGRAEVGIRDDFFELGGHSLLAVRLMVRVEKELGVQLPLATLFQASTVETFAKHLRAQSSRGSSPLVPIRVEGTASPLFLVHAIGGDVLSYRELARALDEDRPVYGLQAAGIDGRGTPLDDVEAMAAHYLEAIRGVQPHGPYFVGGWSFGGLVAFEIARRLRREGEEVALLALLDSVPPGHDAYRNATPAAFARDLAARAGIEVRRVPELAGLSEEDDFAAIVSEARSAKLLPDDAPASMMKALFDVYLANGRAGTSYRPAASPQRALLLQAAGKRDGAAGAWRQLLGSDLEVVSVAGDHYTMLQAPHVDAVAAELNARLTQTAVST